MKNNQIKAQLVYIYFSHLNIFIMSDRLSGDHNGHV